MYYPEELVEEVRARNDIVDVISGYVSLKKKGSNYWGCCPFHNEKTPSFSVSSNKQMYYCFGCHASGNVYTFLMKYENDTFPEAIKILADRAGVKLPEVEETPEQKKKAGKRMRLLEVNKEAAKYFYYMLHKPAGVVTAVRDHHDQTVLDLLVDAPGKDLSPVGRLDKDTEGLLLITNDGALAHRLLSPVKHVPKTYLVHTKKPVTSQMCEKLEAGVEIGDETPTAPAKTKLLSDTDCGLLLTITEGRFHQVKRMLQAVGNEVVYLKRLSMGALVLDETLSKGSWRALTEEEKAQLGV